MVIYSHFYAMTSWIYIKILNLLFIWIMFERMPQIRVLKWPVIFQFQNEKWETYFYLFFKFRPRKPFFSRLQKYITPQILSNLFYYKWKLISNFILKVSCEMKKDTLTQFNFQYSMFKFSPVHYLSSISYWATDK